MGPGKGVGGSDGTLCVAEETWVRDVAGEAVRGGEVTVNAPIGKPPVLYRAESEWAAVLASLKRM